MNNNNNGHTIVNTMVNQLFSNCITNADNCITIVWLCMTKYDNEQCAMKQYNNEPMNKV